MGKKKKKKNSKTNWSLALSIIAIIISGGQLIISSPYFMRYFNEIKIEVKETGISKLPNDQHIQSNFLIRNNSDNTAKEIELSIRVLRNDKIQFIPDVFELKDKGLDNIPVKDLLFKCKYLAAHEEVRVFVYSDFNEYLRINKIDTLEFNKAIKRPNIQVGPYINYLKHSNGKAYLGINDSLELKEIKYSENF